MRVKLSSLYLKKKKKKKIKNKPDPFILILDWLVQKVGWHAFTPSQVALL